MKKRIFSRRLRLVFVAIYIVAAFWWVNSTGGLREALLTIGIALCGGGVLGIVALSFRLKSAFLRFFSPGTLRTGSADEFAHLDQSEWERLTREWRELGFETRVDRAGNMDNPAFGQTFSRTFEHPTEGAVAEISQLFLPDKIGPLTLSVVSFWGERAPTFEMAQRIQQLRAEAVAPLAAPGDTNSEIPATFHELPEEMELWMLITHNRAPNNFWPLLRQKRLLWRRIEGEITPQELWRLHLEQRERVEARLQMPHEIGELEALLEAHGLVLNAQLQRRLQRTPAWKFGLTRLRPAAVPAVYDGELPA